MTEKSIKDSGEASIEKLEASASVIKSYQNRRLTKSGFQFDRHRAMPVFPSMN
jgi:hypothetical protein